MAASEGLGEAVSGRRELELGFEDVYRLHAAAVSRWIQRLWGSRDAEDVLHEVFLVVQRRLPEFRGDSALRTWLYGLTVRVVIARRRKERWRRLLWARAEPELSEAATNELTPQHSLEQREAAALVYSILDRLSERDRALLILYEIEGLSAEAIARVLDIKVGAVWVALTRARARFKRAFRAQRSKLDYGDSHGAR
jgi:RNA polymerase sigma-70 factor (ECF subfamily)